MAVVNTCAFRFRSDIITDGEWSAYMICEVDTFKDWFRLTLRLNEAAFPEYGKRFHMLNEVQVHVIRIDRTYVYTHGKGWRDATDDPPFDIKQQKPFWPVKVPTDDEIYGGKETFKIGRYDSPLETGIPSDSTPGINESNDDYDKRVEDKLFVKNKFVGDYSEEQLIG